MRWTLRSKNPFPAPNWYLAKLEYSWFGWRWDWMNLTVGWANWKANRRYRRNPPKPGYYSDGVKMSDFRSRYAKPD